jgi:tetratricopeptide (TPR) repeat protein
MLDLYNQANALCDQNEFEKAIELYTEAIDIYPYFFEAFDNRALTKMDLAQWDDSIHDFQQSLEIEPNNYTAIFSIGECWFKLGEYKKALSQFESASKLKPDDQLSMEWKEITLKKL